MADDASDKTESATPRRRSEARDSGHLARSQDLTSAVLLLAGLIALSMTAQSMVTGLASLMRALLGSEFAGDTRGMLDNAVRISIPGVFKVVAPIMITVAIAAFLVTVMQVGFHLSPQRLMPNLAKLNPLQGLGRLFGGQNWMQLAMNLAKLLLIGIIGYIELNRQMPVIMSLSAMDFPENFSIGAGIIYELAWRLAVALLLLAVVDWIYHKWKFEKDIRMSKQEVKDEAKMMDGDQEIKGRRRQLARKMIIQRIHRDVPKADVVITNPTELAIALKYDADGGGAPRVVAKGAGFLAARIRQIAISNGVPIVERKPLAQALYKTVEVGQEIPAEFYQAVAEILAYVYELAGKGMRRVTRRTESAAGV